MSNLVESEIFSHIFGWQRLTLAPKLVTGRINHSCAPNCVFSAAPNRWGLRSIRDIAAGEEPEVVIFSCPLVNDICLDGKLGGLKCLQSKLQMKINEVINFSNSQHYRFTSYDVRKFL